jgi:hypothetical protein
LLTPIRIPRAPTPLAMTNSNLLPFSFPAVGRKAVTAAFDGGRLTSDGGMMLLSMAERRLVIVSAQRFCCIKATFADACGDSTSMTAMEFCCRRKPAADDTTSIACLAKAALMSVTRGIPILSLARVSQ